jgi:CBS domain-containing protein
MVKVKDIMTLNPKACMPTTALAQAAHLMWDNDCGILPVVTDGGRVVGVITDRDICMAAAMKGRTLANIAVEEVSSGEVYPCKPTDNVIAALEIMRERRVRRLPVVNDEGLLEGMISMNDIVLQARPSAGKKTELSYGEAIKTYQAICAHNTPTPQQINKMAATI